MKEKKEEEIVVIVFFNTRSFHLVNFGNNIKAALGLLNMDIFFVVRVRARRGGRALYAPPSLASKFYSKYLDLTHT